MLRICEPPAPHKPDFILLQHISEPEFNPAAGLDAETSYQGGKGRAEGGGEGTNKELNEQGL